MSIKLKGSSDGSVSFDAPADTSPSGSDITLVLPTTVGSAEQFLKNSGTAGTLEFSSMVETSTGVGIGTSSPSNVLSLDDTQASGGVGIDITNQGDGGSSTTPYVFINAKLNPARPGGEIRFGREGVYGSESTADSFMAFYTAVNSTNTERLRIDSSGNVGIGTSSPTTPLSVRNSSAISTYGAVSAQFSDNSTGTLYVQHSSGKVQLGSDSALAFGSGTSATERMRIDSSGNLNLVSSASTLTDLNFTASDLNVYARVEGGKSGSGVGDLRFHTYSGGLSEAMRIDSSGRLLLDTTTAEAAHADADDFIIGRTNKSESGMTIVTSTGGNGTINFSDGASSQAQGQIQYYQGTNYMSFDTNGSEAMRMDNTGRTIKLGTSTSGTLVVETTQGAASNKNLIVGGHSATGIDSGTACFVVLSNGNVVNTNNSYGAISDVKLKENIVDASSQWDDIKAVQVRNYNFKESTGQQTHTQLGVVAQELETVSPGLVSDSPDLDADGNDLGTVTKSVNYSVLYMKAVKALQEAIDRIETLETKVAALEAQ